MKKIDITLHSLKKEKDLTNSERLEIAKSYMKIRTHLADSLDIIINEIF